MQAEQANTQRIQLPRSLLGRRPTRNFICVWKFKIGQLVEFYGDRAIVLERSRSAMGTEVYLIHIPGDTERPYRHVRGKALRHIH